jgi:hypothetical protein
MRNRTFGYKGRVDQARKKVLKMLEKKKAVLSSRDDPLRFRSNMITPIHCNLRFKDDEGSTQAELFVMTAIWYYVAAVAAGLAPFAAGVYYLGRSGFLASILMLFGVLIVISSLLVSRMLEKQNDLFYSQQLHSLEFF